MSESLSRGVVYVATGADYLARARVSAASVRRVMPELGLTLFTDEPDAAGQEFDSVLGLEADPRHPRLPKLEGLIRTPYDETWYLDADTYVTGRCLHVFRLLERFDLALAHAVGRTRKGNRSLPAAFPEYNGGVLLYRRSPAVLEALERWQSEYCRLEAEMGIRYDQYSLRETLWHSSLRVGTLPPEYNCLCAVLGYLCGPAWVLHGHYDEPAFGRIAEAINQETGRRCHVDGKVWALDDGKVRLIADYGRVGRGERRTRARGAGLGARLRRALTGEG